MNNEMLPDWLRGNSGLTTSSDSKPKTKAGEILLRRFSEITNPESGIVTRFTNKEAADNFVKHYTLSERSVRMITGDNVDECFPTANYKPQAPTIAIIRDAFGQSAVDNLLTNNIELINQYSGSKNKMDLFAISGAARAIEKIFSEDNSRLNAREILLFFFMVVNGELGRFYGEPDSMALGEMALKFVEWRKKQIDRLCKEEEDKLRKERIERMNREAVPPPPGALDLIRKTIESIGHPEMRKRTLNDVRHIDENYITRFEPQSEEDKAIRAQHEAEFYRMLELEKQKQSNNNK